MLNSFRDKKNKTKQKHNKARNVVRRGDEGPLYVTPYLSFTAEREGRSSGRIINGMKKRKFRGTTATIRYPSKL